MRAVRAAMMVLLAALGTANAQYFSNDRNSCRSCHEDHGRKTDFCELFEATVYERDDKHGKAFLLLHESDEQDPTKGQAKRDLVEQILGFKLSDAFADDRYMRLNEPKADDKEMCEKVAKVKACLRCHATWPVKADELSPKQPPVALELGVSCQACHGPGLKWNVLHRFEPYVWRAVTPAGKHAVDFTDVRTTARKAELCASCHIGNVKERKFIKHEWYARGHPPLPSFELASFQAQLPVHWKPLADKPNFAFRDGTVATGDSAISANIQLLVAEGVPRDAIKSSYLQAHGLTPSSMAGGLSRTKDIVVGGAVGLRVYVDVLNDFASLESENNELCETENKVAWPELSLYDCSACHHQLRSGLAVNLRPKRPHAPGRPPLAVWPSALAKLADQVGTVGNGQADWPEIEKKLIQLDRAMTERPFGNRDAIAKAGQPLAIALRQIGDYASQVQCSEETARQLVESLTHDSRPEINDFYSARQVAWAIRGVAIDLELPGAERYFLRGDDDPLCLILPSGPNQSVMENLQRWLPAASNYDPTWFRKELQAVRASFLR